MAASTANVAAASRGRSAPLVSRANSSAGCDGRQRAGRSQTQDLDDRRHQHAVAGGVHAAVPGRPPDTVGAGHRTSGLCGEVRHRRLQHQPDDGQHDRHAARDERPARRRDASRVRLRARTPRRSSSPMPEPPPAGRPIVPGSVTIRIEAGSSARLTSAFISAWAGTAPLGAEAISRARSGAGASTVGELCRPVHCSTAPVCRSGADLRRGRAGRPGRVAVRSARGRRPRRRLRRPRRWDPVDRRRRPRCPVRLAACRFVAFADQQRGVVTGLLGSRRGRGLAVAMASTIHGEHRPIVGELLDERRPDRAGVSGAVQQQHPATDRQVGSGSRGRPDAPRAAPPRRRRAGLPHWIDPLLSTWTAVMTAPAVGRTACPRPHAPDRPPAGGRRAIPRSRGRVSDQPGHPIQRPLLVGQARHWPGRW